MTGVAANRYLNLEISTPTMNKPQLFLTVLSLATLFACSEQVKDQVNPLDNQSANTKTEVNAPTPPTEHPKKNVADFIPKGYVQFGQVMGDLNKDGKEDCVLIIKGTDKSKFVKDEERGTLDRNRRGLIILFNTENGYEVAAKNYSCFSSENEDGGVYFPPDLSLEIKKGNLYVNYAHGRYGYWGYNFRYQNSNFELIGYESSYGFGPVVERETSINFLTKKKIVKENVNEDQDQDSGEEVFKTTKKDIKLTKPFKLTEIKDFDVLEFSGL